MSKLIDNQGSASAAAHPNAVYVPRSPTLATDPLHEGANVKGMVPITETAHRGEDTARNTAAHAAAVSAASMAPADLKLLTSDH